MAFKLEPIEIVAICLASLAVLLIIFYAIYKLTKSCRTSSSASTTPIHESRDQYGYRYGGGGGGGGGGGNGYNYGVNDNNPYMNYPYSAGSSSKGRSHTPTPTTIQPSPSTGHTTLVTPSTTSGGKNGNGHKLKKGGIGLIHSPWQSSNKEKEKVDMEGKTNDELVVVTYEDGLRKLGIQPIREISQGSQGGEINQYRNVPPINTNVSFVNPNPNPNLYTSASTITTTPSATVTRPEMVERESSRRTYHSVAGRGHGAGRRGYTNTMGTMGSNLLPSYYIETNAGDD